MPPRIVPLDESNDCHTPGGSAAGGQFCSGGGRSEGELSRERLRHAAEDVRSRMAATRATLGVTPGPSAGVTTSKLTTKSPTDVAQAKGLRVGQSVTINGYDGTVTKVAVARRTRPRFHPTDPTSLVQTEEPYETVTVKIKNTAGQIGKFTFRTS